MRQDDKARIAAELGAVPLEEKQRIAESLGATSVNAEMPIPPPQTPTSAAQRAIQAITPYLPSGRTAAQVGGAMIGGVAGMPLGIPGMAAGGAFGGAGGESLYQFIQTLRGQQGGVDPAAIAKAAIQGGAQEGLGGAVTAMAEKGLQRGMEKTTTRLLQPGTLAEKEQAATIAPKVAQQISPQWSEEAVVSTFKANLNNANKALEAEFAKIPQNIRFRTDPVKTALQTERAGLEIQGELVPGKENQAAAYDRLIDWFNRHPKFTIAELRQNRQLWDELVNWSKSQLAGRSESELVYKSGADKVRALINDTFPNIAKANDQVHVWKTASDLIGKAETRGIGKGGIPMGTAIAGSLGATIGGAFGGTPGASIGASTGVLIRELVKTPAWQTASIAARRLAIQALQRGDVNTAVRTITGVGLTQTPQVILSNREPAAQ